MISVFERTQMAISLCIRDVTRQEISLASIYTDGSTRYSDEPLASNIRSTGTDYTNGVLLSTYSGWDQRICRIPRAHAHNRPYTLALIPTRLSRCTQNSGRAFIFVDTIYFRPLSRLATRAVLSLFLSLSLSLR